MSLHAQDVSFPFVSSPYISLGSPPPCLQSTCELWAVPGAVQACSAVIPISLGTGEGMAQAGVGGTRPSRSEATSFPLLPQ